MVHFAFLIVSGVVLREDSFEVLVTQDKYKVRDNSLTAWDWDNSLTAWDWTFCLNNCTYP